MFRDCLELFSPIKAPNPGAGCDVIAWFPTLDGVFSLKTAYKAWTENDPLDRNRLFKGLWKLEVPQRVKASLWVVMNDALLTNHARL